EVHAAEDDVPGAGVGGDAGELVAVAGEVGEADDFVALVVVTEQDGGCAEFGASCGNAGIHGMVGEREVVFKTATRAGLRRGRRQIVENDIHSIPPSVQLTLAGRRTGMLKASTAAVDALTFLKRSAQAPNPSGKPPSTGLLQPF